MEIISVAPHHTLSQVVKSFWYANIQDAGRNKSFKILADGAMGIVFQHSNGSSSLTDANGNLFPISFAYGQKQDSPCINTFHGNSFVFGVNLQPTAFKKLFHINASTITNAIIETDTIFSKEFTDRLLYTTSPQQVIQLFSAQLQQKLRDAKHDRIIDLSVKMIFDDKKGMNPYEVSSNLNISRRQFQRKFKEHMGVCPETYLRIIRFQKSLHLLKTKSFNKLGDVGYHFNYADQSHFIREFKLFAGCTPKEFTSAMKLQPYESTPFDTVRILS
ncbi:AraC family transcriptional regulator [Chitinophaga sp. sic0106]|uniref:helix-turn-helix domain-containing protein n=1 Tax=Chitinophaga sp. sic0106 TaxID=2854785 RepID=UPI001C44E39C|nr:AraC family transcriptional regulator [Chitinophaga sp. sic0106]MBV7533719.1 AraC family transcriptional regulator [Chitinophaga sp. sic0106]